MSTERVKVRCVLVIGEGDRAIAYLETPWHPSWMAIQWSAAVIAAQADLPRNELPGREFWVDADHGPANALSLTNFRLVFDPRL
ncbi:hypothetical protein ACWDOP_05575 [Nocardia sp. NPDC003693]